MLCADGLPNCLPRALTRLIPLKARQCTFTPNSVSASTAARTSIVLRQLGDHEDVSRLHAVHQAGKARAPRGHHGAADRLFNDLALVDGEASPLNLKALILSSLVRRGHTAVGEDTAHIRYLYERGVRLQDVSEKLTSLFPYIHASPVRNRTVLDRPSLFPMGVIVLSSRTELFPKLPARLLHGRTPESTMGLHAAIHRMQL